MFVTVIALKYMYASLVSQWSYAHYVKLTHSIVFEQHDNSDKHFTEFLPKRWRQKSTNIDMEQSYVMSPYV